MRSCEKRLYSPRLTIYSTHPRHKERTLERRVGMSQRGRFGGMIMSLLSSFMAYTTKDSFMYKSKDNTAIYRDRAMSSILKIILTVSAANSMALVLTNNGCSTFSSAISFLTPPLLMLIPAFFCPCACLCLKSVTTLMLFNPAFSASVVGMTSRASANAFQQMDSVPESWRASVESWCAISISGAPPPARSAFFLTRERMAQ